jgi:hypothetical protein
MNLFILSLCQKECAEFMFDKHIVKIILEAVQMLCAAKQLLNPPMDDDEESPVGKEEEKRGEQEKNTIKPKLYKITHKNHPVSIWVRASLANYMWTLDLVDAMHEEWKYRYNHPPTKEHKSYVVAKYLREHAPKEEEFSYRGLLPFAQAMPDEYKCSDSDAATNLDPAVIAYRAYYMSEEKSKLTCWKKRGKPEWFS